MFRRRLDYLSNQITPSPDKLHSIRTRLPVSLGFHSLRSTVTASMTPPNPGDYDTANSAAVRKRNRTYGLVPPVVESFEVQNQRCLEQLMRKSRNIDKYLYLSGLRNANVHLFYRLVVQYIKDIAPLIYTPTVGEACLKWSQNYVQPEGLYLSYSDRGNIAAVLQNWSQPVQITVVTDGSRILGLGDLGVNGMGIPVGKLALYVACAGIPPEASLPLMLDLGTGNKTLKEDPLYMGSKRDRVTADEEMEFLEELMAALNERWPGLVQFFCSRVGRFYVLDVLVPKLWCSQFHRSRILFGVSRLYSVKCTISFANNRFSIVVQFEDFKNPFPALERFRSQYTCFNDDIQGTGAVILAGMVNAIKRTGIPVRDQRAVFFGAGSAGVGVAKEIVEYFMREGLTEEEARRCFWLVDTKGLITNDRGDKLANHKVYFSRSDNDGKQYKTLDEVIDYVQPSILMGLSTTGGVFSPKIIAKMGQWNQYPIIFPLSNPSANSECTFEDAIRYTDGRALFASGSPFEDFDYQGKHYVPGQGELKFES